LFKAVGEQIRGEHNINAFFIRRGAGPGRGIDQASQPHFQVWHLLDAVKELLLTAVALRLLLHTDNGIVVVNTDKPALFHQFLAEFAHINIRAVKIPL
jgi:hypothetical protein